MGIPDHLTCFLRNLYAGQEATIRTEHEINKIKIEAEKMLIKKKKNWTWNNRLVPNQERSMSKLYVVTLLI